jgi:hypothetical protein
LSIENVAFTGRKTAKRQGDLLRELAPDLMLLQEGDDEDDDSVTRRRNARPRASTLKKLGVRQPTSARGGAFGTLASLPNR